MSGHLNEVFATIVNGIHAMPSLAANTIANDTTRDRIIKYSKNK